MPSFESRHCLKCPYLDQVHLPPEWCQARETVPLDVEDNESDILLVAQAPGEAEWEIGKPLQPTVKQGGTAGSRIAQSWERTNKERKSFNITNAVQCFPGKEDPREKAPRDLAPVPAAVRACSGWLRDAMCSRRYRKVIAFGEVAALVVGIIATLEDLPCEVQYARHPNSGVSNEELDRLWE
ncbi:uracil-DNA glycosylase family protein [Corallococcus sp. AS-1-12]|uniref:uracil-DNA glycosylase family protein n=1 Tax=Myxococcaceae TaxID=31 RepID=UPI00351D37AE